MDHAVYHHEFDVARRLEQLGLEAEVLREAVAIGEVARNSCTENDPVGLPGILAWGRTTRGLRDLLTPMDWRRNEEGTLSTVVSPDGALAIAVATGDESTGRPECLPRTKYPKGPATVAAVQRNRVQLSLFEPTPPRPAVAACDCVTWLLLIARGGEEVRCELSLPAAIGEDGRVESWAERIVLEPVGGDGQPRFSPADEEPEIVVEIARRGR